MTHNSRSVIKLTFRKLRRFLDKAHTQRIRDGNEKHIEIFSMKILPCKILADQSNWQTLPRCCERVEVCPFSVVGGELRVGVLQLWSRDDVPWPSVPHLEPSHCGTADVGDVARLHVRLWVVCRSSANKGLVDPVGTSRSRLFHKTSWDTTVLGCCFPSHANARDRVALDVQQITTFCSALCKRIEKHILRTRACSQTWQWQWFDRLCWPS